MTCFGDGLIEFPTRLATERSQSVQDFNSALFHFSNRHVFDMLQFAIFENWRMSENLFDALVFTLFRIGMALVDSEAAFEQRLNEVVADAPSRTAIVTNGIRTFSALAFSAGTPQSPPSDDTFRTFADSVLPAGYNMATYSALRRLHFEAATFVVAQLKQKVTGEGEEGRQKLPTIEKQARLADQKRRLTGIDIEGEMQPSYALIDAVNGMIETSSVLWIAPSKATSREQEIQHGSKSLPSVVQLEHHTLKLSAPEANFEAEHSTTIQLQWCLQRRALALDQVRLSSWDCQNKWINQLLTVLNTPPPAGHSRITLEQLIKADKQLWTELAKMFTGAVVAATAGTEPPFDEHILRLRHDPRVTMFLLPLPSFAKETKQQGPQHGTPSNASAKGAPKPQPKKKFKATKKAGRNKPEVLAGMETITKDGQNVCWSFNMESGCQASLVAGSKVARCAKGLHVCAYCHKANHSQLVCNLKKRSN